MVTADTVLAQQPVERQCPVELIRTALPRARRMVVLDDDPTGTQTVRDVPVLTRWEVADVRWALRMSTAAIFILANTRSLLPDEVTIRYREIARACLEAARAERIEIVFASRSDSTLRGHFPLETDLLTDLLSREGIAVDGVLVVPAYIDAGRITVDGMQWVLAGGEFVAVGETEFARDATFGFRTSYLPAWIEEKSRGGIHRDNVIVIPLRDIRRGVSQVAKRLAEARGGAFVVIDAATDNDLRIVVSAVLAAEAEGRHFVYRVGPSFVRARCGQEQAHPLSRDSLRTLMARQPGRGGGLVVIGSHVDRSTRQLERLRARVPMRAIEVDVTAALDSRRSAEHVTRVAKEAADALAESHVVLASTRTVHIGSSPHASLQIARRISSVIAEIVARIVALHEPSFILAKGGITSADIATEGLRIVQSWVRGTLLEGIVSLWQPNDGLLPGTPYVVFAGNVGDDDALASVVEKLAAAG